MPLTFLSSLIPPVDLTTANPSLVVNYLISKDIFANTQYHHLDCPHKGWSDPWSPLTLSGNPADSSMVRSYLEFLQREGQAALLTPVKATPVFPEKLAAALSYWSSIADHAQRTRIDRSTLATHAGDRGSDIDCLDPNAITWLPDGNGIHISLYTGKTIKARMVERIILCPSPTQTTCVIHALREYAMESRTMGYPLLDSRYVFPSITPVSYDPNSTISYPVMQQRFATALPERRCYINETLHGLRIASAISAVVADDGISAAMAAGHWRSPATAAQYSQLARAVTPQSRITAINWQRALLKWPLALDLLLAGSPAYFP
ncbi:hypothetical protein BC829DRAFT_439372 [Chytridium lagenaria]|nr:hypothetical protein BC829DRAFT_439372 [Chytridium lagenaria]